MGPKVGKDLTQKAILALALAWVAMLIYIGFRFEFRYAVGGILALIHDVLVTVGVLSLLNMEFTLNTVAALLTIIGFSINDTIVIYDRIRENVRKKIRADLRQIVNVSVNETLSRTILTSLTVFLVLVVLLVLGGPVIFDFCLRDVCRRDRRVLFHRIHRQPLRAVHGAVHAVKAQKEVVP